jgi:hypothetical protein
LTSNQSSRAVSLFVPALVVFALTIVLAPSVADVDLWGHVRFGGDIVRARAIPVSDPYSFTADRPWINHEWLAEVLIYTAYATGGGGGLTALRLTLIGLMLWLVRSCLRAAGVSGPREITLLALVAVLTYTRTQHVRPQLFSLVLFAALATVLIRARSSSRALWFAPIIMALWVNVHGGWIVGLGVFTLWCATQFVNSRARWTIAAVALVTIAVTLVNPYGTGLWAFLWETVGLGRPDIDEWLPIRQSQPGVITFWIVSAACGLIAVARAWTRRVDRDLAALCAVLGVLSFRVSRLDAFFTIAVFSLGARALAGAQGTVASREHGPLAAGSSPMRTRAMAVAIVCALALRWHALTAIDLESTDWLPEADAIDFMRAEQLRGTMVTYFDWGEYAIWHLAPSIKVSMDGRRETVYRSGVIQRHLAVYASDPSGLAYLEELKPDFVWLPKGLPIVRAMESHHGWTTIYEGAHSALLTRGACPTRNGAPADGRRRVFPGP